MLVQHINKNTKGRDFVVGDIHGCFSRLQYELDCVLFNPEIDRLFCVGDLIDRGPENERVLDWLAKPWFFSVKGNHEDMLVDSVAYKDNQNAVNFHTTNGGEWFHFGLLSENEKMDIAVGLNDLPVAIEVETDQGLIGIVHAEPPTNDWEESFALLGSGAPKYAEKAMWARTRINFQLEGMVSNVHKVYVGHTPVNRETVLGNVHYIDGGTCFIGGKMFLVRIQ